MEDDTMKLEKKLERKEKNRLAKLAKAAQRQANLAMVGKLVFEREVTDPETGDKSKVLDFPPAIRTSLDGSILPLADQRFPNFPRHAFVGGKTFKQSYLSMKNRPGNHILHGEAIVEDASRSFAKAVEAAMTPAEEVPVPVVPENLAGEAAQL
jgi:hypothetical protein